MEAPLDDPAVVGVDLGGTKIFGALASRDGTLAHETYVAHAGAAERGGAPPTSLSPRQRGEGRGEGPAADAFDRLATLIATLLDRAREQHRAVRGIGVGAPSIIRDAGVVLSAPPLGWKDFPLARRLTERFGLPAAVENDVNLAALGELHFGAGRGSRSLFCLAVGTGIGGALIVDGKLWRGAHGAAGEIGALLPGREFAAWQNPDWGALETVASGSGLAVRAGRPAEELFAAAAAGDAAAQALVEETIDYLAVAVAAVQAIADPDVIVLAGGVSAAADRILPGIERRLARALAFPPRVVRTQLGYRAAVLGAAALI